MGFLARVKGLIRGDGWTNQITGMGTLARDKTENTSFCPEATIPDWELSAIYAHNDLGKLIVDAPLDEAFRRGFCLTVKDAKGKVDRAKTKALEDVTHHVSCAVKEAFRWARVYGGAAVYPNIKGGPPVTEPLDETKVSEVIALPVFDRRYVWPNSYGFDSDCLEYAPLTYGFSTDGLTATEATLIDESRFLRVIGVPTDRRRRQELNYWGDSVFQSVYGALRRYGSADQSALQLLQDASQFVFSIKGVISGIESGNKAYLQDRMALVDMQRGIGKAVLLDSEGNETVYRSNASFSGVKDMLDHFAARLSAATKIPVSILFGVGPAGMNATGEMDLRMWHKQVQGFQRNELEPLAWELIELYCTSLGIDPETVDLEWHDLAEPTLAERGTIEKTFAEKDQIYFNIGQRYEEILLSRFGKGEWSPETQVDTEELEASLALPKPEPMDPAAMDPGAEPGMDPAMDPAMDPGKMDGPSDQDRDELGRFA